MLRGVYCYDLPERITDGIDGVRLERFTEDPDDYRNHADREGVSILIARQGVVNDMLRYYPNIRWLQLLNAGFEKVDLDLLKARGIWFTNARSVYCGTIAEDVLAKILLLARQYPRHFADRQKHFWPDDEQLPNHNIDLDGKVLGILGAGAIGREIARRAAAFGLIVRGYDPYVSQQEGFETIYGAGEMARLLGESDFVITSLPVTNETRGIMNADALKMMKPSAYLINVARGEIVDEAALAEALKSGRIAGAAIDVARHEPLPPDDPLWDAPNLIITPHRAAYGDQMKLRMGGLIERNLHHYLRGEPLEDRIL